MKIKPVYIVSTLKRCGPNRQLLYIIKYLDRVKFDPVIFTLSPEEKDSMMDEFREICPNIFPLELSRINGLLKAADILKSRINALQSPVIHSQGIRPDYYSAFFLSNYPRIATLRNYPFMDYPFKYGKLKGSLMARGHLKFLSLVEKPFTNSEAVSRLLKEKHNFSIIHINNGVEPEVFEPDETVRKKLRKQLKIAGNARVFLSTGHLTEQKDPLTVIKGFCSAKLNKDDRLIILGDGKLLEDCKSLSATDERVLIQGRVNNVHDYIKASDYYISASLTEGLPNSVLEAMAGGLPVVLSNILPHHLILDKDPVCGESFKLADADDLAEKINHLISKNRDEIKVKCLDVIRKHFNAEEVSKRYQKEYADFYPEQAENI